MGITVVKLKPNFQNEVKLCDMSSNPFFVIHHLQVLIYYLQSIVYQMEKGKFANIGFAIVESHVHIRENLKASREYDGQFFLFSSLPKCW